MGGPCASIILNLDPADSDRTEVESILEALGPIQKSSHPEQWLEGWIETTTTIAGTYTGEGRPFGAQLVSAEAMRLDEDRSSKWRECVVHEFALLPVAEIRLWMGCNQREDHRVLGELSLHLAVHLGGLIDFTGALMAPLGAEPHDVASYRMDHANWSDIDGPTKTMLAELPGKVFGMPYQTANGRLWVSHICTPDFMTAWLRHQHFHMIK